ncbi:hypothetical protein EQG68_14080 [Flavobacterium piscinae]|uniref:VWA domain-containing protein n=2 Tax=Flavobacterium piscinae TaxID=2506424 RepID=A0A4Q1KHW6_9FLAO|nr:hypothetical protein [Flavobacterium piscinae]RXR28719.1 hypothetical protein EQG68_14080 [Flavobacterium piscinae]
MTTTTVLLLLLSVLIAGGVSFFQYFYKTKTNSKVYWLLAFLRFVAVFGLLILLINPILTRKSFETIKIPLPIVVDNSSSVIELKANESALDVYKKLTSNADLQDKFEVQSYQFSSELESSESYDFKGTQTRIDGVGKGLKSIHKSINHPTVIITDGNQTQGNDYIYSFDENKAVYPVVLGDTTAVLDLKISQLNVNKYAFLKNKFPVEVFVNYSGNKNVNATFSISQGNTVLSKQNVDFSNSQKSKVITVLLPAEKVGVQVFKATISSSEQEKNTYNNSKNFAVEIIDQKTEVAIVSSINHPDIGALKRAIESNQQRKVSILKPSQIKSLQDFNVLILYQPTSEFKSVFEKNNLANLNTWMITGLHTDFNFLNQQQTTFDFKMSSQQEDYLATFSSQFNLFAIDNIGFENFPPLQNPFGTITSKTNYDKLIGARIRNVELDSPLLAYTENQGKRSAFLLGENIWKWRLQSHIDQQSFQKFDVFIDKTIQFLASNNARKSLVVTHENFYNSGDAIEINAQYFNKNYEFDDNARLSITVKNKATNQTKSYDLLKSTNSYKVNFDGLSAGNYSFTVTENNSKTSYSGFFDVLDFDIEKQFVNPDYAKLNQLATQTKGKTYLANQVDELVQSLLANENYKPIQKEIIKKTPVIDWVWLLIIIVLALGTEWFIRKYNGLL